MVMSMVYLVGGTLGSVRAGVGVAMIIDREKRP
jgi:hypothetical protein